MKFNRLLLMALMAIGAITAKSQNSVGIGTETPNTNAVLHLVSPSNDQGFLIPSMTTAQRSAISFTAAESGMMVFDSDEQSFYYWSAGQWNPISAQTLTAGTGITIDGSLQITNTGDLDATNEIQDLDLTGDILTITNNGSATSIDLSAYLDNTDSQDLDFTSGIITLSGDPDATAIDLSLYDTDVTDDFDGDFSNLSGVPADLADGDDVDDADADPTNEIQDLQLVGNDLTITNNGSATTIDLLPYLDNTDNQIITDFNVNNLTNVITLTLESGNTQTINLSTVLANANTDNQSLSLVGDNLSLTNGGSIDLSGYLDDTDTDDQTITDFSINGSNVLSMTLDGGNTATVDLSQLSGAGGTDDQLISGLSIDGSNVLSVTIEDGNTATVDLSQLSGAGGTDDQLLSLSGDDLILEDGGSVDLSGYLDNTDNQTLSLGTDILSLTNGGSVNLSAYNNSGTDDQQISLSTNVLTLENGGTVNLAGYLDDTDDQTAAQVPVTPTGNLDSNNVQAALQEHQTDINAINSAGYITTESDPSVPANLKDGVSWGEISGIPADISNGDNQSLSFNSGSGTLSISGGNSVNISTSSSSAGIKQVFASEFLLEETAPQSNIGVVYQNGGTKAVPFVSDGSGTAILSTPLSLPDGVRIGRLTFYTSADEPRGTVGVRYSRWAIPKTPGSEPKSGEVLGSQSVDTKDEFHITPLEISDPNISNQEYVYTLEFICPLSNSLSATAGAIHYVIVEYE